MNTRGAEPLDVGAEAMRQTAPQGKGAGSDGAGVARAAPPLFIDACGDPRRTALADGRLAGGRYAQQWANHCYDCARCSAVDIRHTATFAGACVAGASMLKDLLAARERERAR